MCEGRSDEKKWIYVRTQFCVLLFFLMYYLSNYTLEEVGRGNRREDREKEGGMNKRREGQANNTYCVCMQACDE